MYSFERKKYILMCIISRKMTKIEYLYKMIGFHNINILVLHTTINDDSKGRPHKRL